MPLYSIGLVDIVGYIGSCTAVISILPQIIQTYKTKSAKDISILMLINLTISSASWTLYGILTHDNPLIITNALLTVGSGVMVALKYKYHL